MDREPIFSGDKSKQCFEYSLQSNSDGNKNTTLLGDKCNRFKFSYFILRIHEFSWEIYYSPAINFLNFLELINQETKPDMREVLIFLSALGLKSLTLLIIPNVFY